MIRWPCISWNPTLNAFDPVTYVTLNFPLYCRVMCCTYVENAPNDVPRSESVLAYVPHGRSGSGQLDHDSGWYVYPASISSLLVIGAFQVNCDTKFGYECMTTDASGDLRADRFQ